MTTLRAFPVLYTEDVSRLADFYVLLGFERAYQFPPDVDDPGYVSLQLGEATLGITTFDSPRMLIGVEPGPGPRCEMFVYVSDLDATVEQLRASGITIKAEPQDMPWGERLAYAIDPDGNPVALAASATP